MRGTHVSEEQVEGGDPIEIIGIAGRGGLAYVRTDAGDFDLTGTYELNFLTDDGGIDLPNQYGRAFVTGSYILRRADGISWKLDASPGLYSDFEDFSAEDFAIPFGASVIRAFSDQMSGIVGLAFYPGFERNIDPRLGLRWALMEQLTIDMMYPESRILFNPVEAWDVYASVHIDRVSEYTLEEDDNRDALLFEETRWAFGLRHPLGEDLRMTWEAGFLRNRSVDFAHHGEKRDIDDGIYFSVGVGAAL